MLAGARAIVVTAVEEFGIAAVEALAAGRPVIAFGDGGVRESVQSGVTGVFYERNDPAALAETVLAFDALGVDSAACRAAAERFSVPRFQSRARGDRGRRRLGRAPAAPRRAPGARGRAAQWRAPRGPAGGAGPPLAHRLGSPCKPPFRSFGRRAECPV